MATTSLSPNFSLQPRASHETDRRHLLAPSIAPSESISHADDDGERTPRAHSPAPSDRTAASTFRIPANQRRDTIADPTTTPAPYKGFPSEAHYLAALHEWAESKKYIQTTDSALIGFYGETTMQDYASRPKMEGLGLRKKWRARREAKQGERRNTVT